MRIGNQQRSHKGKPRVTWASVFFILTVLLTGSPQALAQDPASCNGDLDFTILNKGPYFLGERMRVYAELGAKDIVNGTTHEISGFGFATDCHLGEDFNSCTETPAVVDFPDPINWSTDCNTKADGTGEEVSLRIPQGTVPIKVGGSPIQTYANDQCNIQFDMMVTKLADDPTVKKARIVQAMGWPTSFFNDETNQTETLAGSCDNGLTSSASSTISYEVNTCDIEVIKEVSLDGSTWFDANTQGEGPELFVGEYAYYRLKVKNTSSVDFVDNLLVTDEKLLGADPVAVTPNFVDGEMIIGGAGSPFEIGSECRAEGFVENTASVEGICRSATSSAGKFSATAEDNAWVNCRVRTTSASINLVKSALPTEYNTLGQEIIYSFLVTNPSNVPLINVNVVDPLPGLSAISCPRTELAANGDSMTCTATYNITQDDLDFDAITNTAIASGEAPNGDKVKDDDWFIIVSPQDDPEPSLALLKTAEPLTYSAAGQTITYDYELTNTGNVSLFPPYNVIDDKATVTCPAEPAELNPSESVFCDATYVILPGDVVAGEVTNVAYGTAMDAEDDGLTVRSNDDEETVYYTGIQVRKEIQDKDGAWLPADSPETAPWVYWNSGAKYRIFVKNIGQVVLENVSITDFDPDVGLDGFMIGTLNPGQEFEVHSGLAGAGGLDVGLVCDHTDDFENTATASGTAFGSGQTVVDSDVAWLSCVGRPDIEILKEVSVDGGSTYVDATQIADEPQPAGPVEVGSAVHYRITVTNTGDVDLENVTVTDADIPGSPYLIGNLPKDAPGNEVVLTSGEWAGLSVDPVCSVPGFPYNLAEVEGDSTELEGDGASAEDDATVECIGPPSIEIVKYVKFDGEATWLDANGEPYPTAVVDGTAETAVYKIVVTNKSDEVDLYNVVVNDEKMNLVDYPIGALLAGESVVLVATGHGEAGDIELDLSKANICDEPDPKVNVADVLGYSAAGTEAIDEDPAKVDCVDAPSILLTKLVSDDGVNFSPVSVTSLAPSHAYYRFEVFNNGSVPLTNVIVEDDDLLPGVTIPVGDLAVGQTKVVAHDSTGDVEWPRLLVEGFCSEAGTYPNTAWAYGYDEISEETAQDDDTATYICEVPELICDGSDGVLGRKPAALKMRYDGTFDSNHNQGTAPIIDPDITGPMPQTVRVVSYNKPGGNNTKTLDVVKSVNEFFTIGGWGGDNRIPSNVLIEFYEVGTDNLIQSVLFHGSCSAPLVKGDEFGGAVLYDYTP